MTTLTEFLLARIAEDEEQASRAKADVAMNPNTTAVPASWVNRVADRVLAECEAKRRIVEGITKGTAGEGTRRFVLSSLALPYADHPDFDPAWRP